ERPTPRRRKVFVTPAQFAAIPELISDQYFRDYFTFLFETGEGLGSLPRNWSEFRVGSVKEFVRTPSDSEF
ncbi:MAG: hypothetical protein KDA81_22190, partial [Planctomycetaceae bacterium]|nr:hypothetical protein [Planctomycetaceae bacterium]